MGIRNSESRIRAFVNDPALGNTIDNELLPDTAAEVFRPDGDSIVGGNRISQPPRIGGWIKQIQAAGVRLNMLRNELLPFLNLVLDTYVSGLRGNSNVGVRFSTSIARASLATRLAFSTKCRSKIDAPSSIRPPSHGGTAVGSTDASHDGDTAVCQVEAAVAEVDYLLSRNGCKLPSRGSGRKLRWRYYMIAGSFYLAMTDPLSVLLEDLLDAQERLNAAEFAFLTSQFGYNTSHMAYQRAGNHAADGEHFRRALLRVLLASSATSARHRRRGGRSSRPAPYRPQTNR